MSAISLQEFLQYGLHNSEDVKQIKSKLLGKDISSLQDSQLRDLLLSSKFSNINNQKFISYRNDFFSGPYKNSFNLGIEKNFVSGTSLKVSSYYGFGENLNAMNNSSFMNFNPQSVNTSIGEKNSDLGMTLYLRQNLLNDAFGYASIKRKHAAILEDNIVTLGVASDIEDWIIKVTEIYYSIWLLNSQIESEINRLNSQKRLLKVAHVKRDRGVDNQSDIFEIEAGMSLAQGAIVGLEQEAENRLRDLEAATNLKTKLREFYNGEAKNVLNLGKRRLSYKDICDFQMNDLHPMALQALQKKVSASNLSLEASKNQTLPNVFIEGAFNQNSNKGSHFFKEPNYFIGLGFSYNIFSYKERANYHASLMNKTRSVHEILAFKTRNYSQYKNYCETYRVSKEIKKMILESISKYKKRQEIEEKRFRLGRSDATRVIYAMKDLINAEFERAKVERKLSVSYWKILKSFGKINEEIQYIE